MCSQIEDSCHRALLLKVARDLLGHLFKAWTPDPQTQIIWGDEGHRMVCSSDPGDQQTRAWILTLSFINWSPVHLHCLCFILLVCTSKMGTS